MIMMNRLRKNKFQLNSQPKISGKDRNKSVLRINVVCRSNKLRVCMIAIILLTAGPLKGHTGAWDHTLCAFMHARTCVCALRASGQGKPERKGWNDSHQTLQ